MNQRILLITGWGGGVKLLHSLQQALQQQGHDVELINIFDALDAQILQQQVEKARNADVIIGWSLGGQLATVLVDQIAQQYAEHKVLITLASNPCFVANEKWPMAMDEATFESFKQSFAKDVTGTLRKFGFMVCQGTSTAKQDFIKLQSLIQAQNLAVLSKGLNCLEKLNTVSIIQKYAGYQYHLFAKQDFLVGYKVQAYLQNLSAIFLETELLSGSHGFPVFDAETISCKICHYLKKISQTNG